MRTLAQGRVLGLRSSRGKIDEGAMGLLCGYYDHEETINTLPCETLLEQAVARSISTASEPLFALDRFAPDSPSHLLLACFCLQLKFPLEWNDGSLRHGGGRPIFSLLL